MAVIKAVNSKASIGKAIKYITKEEKTEEKLISGKDCSPETAIDEMKATKEQWRKMGGRQYTHLVQSFNPKDKVTPKQAHEIGMKFIESNEKFKGYEVLIATHIDKEHVHNHFIINSVSFESGKKFHSSKAELESLKLYSNTLSKEHGFSIPTRGDSITTFKQKKYRAIEKGATGKEKSYLLDIARAIGSSLKNSIDKESFIKDMEKKGYEVNWKDTRKYITFTTLEGKKVRNSNLEKTFKEDKFSKEGMENEIQRNRESIRGKSRVPSGIQGREQQATGGSDERNKRAEQANAELHKGSHEGRYSNTNDTRQRFTEDTKNKSTHSGQNDFDIGKARNIAEELRQKTSSTYGKWQSRNESEQSRSTGENDRDRAALRDKHGKDELEHGKQTKQPGTKNIGFTR